MGVVEGASGGLALVPLPEPFHNHPVPKPPFVPPLCLLKCSFVLHVLLPQGKLCIRINQRDMPLPLCLGPGSPPGHLLGLVGLVWPAGGVSGPRHGQHFGHMAVQAVCACAGFICMLNCCIVGMV